MEFRNFCCASLLGCGVVFGISGQATAGNLRIVDWNIEADVNGNTLPLPGVNTVLQGIGNEIAVNGARPLDIMALEETTSNSVTVQPIVDDLNADYGAGTYAMSPFQATLNTAVGSGPSSLVYNTKTVTLISAVGVGTVGYSANGEYRQVVRYEFQPIGGTSPFYIYDSHMKSGGGSPNNTYRGEEAVIIRNDEANLPANSSVIYTGDLNADPSETGETQFTTFGTPTATNSMNQTVTQGSATDPDNYSTALNMLTESATSLRYRDDYQLMTADIINGTGAIKYVSGSLRSFGNNGTAASDVDDPANTDLSYMTAAAGYSPTQSDILSALTTASDHLPNVADYTFTSVPEPTSLALIAGSGLLLSRRRSGSAM